MQAAELLAKNKNPSRDDIVAHMDGNICRCGTYLKIISAIQRAAAGGADREPAIKPQPPRIPPQLPQASRWP